MAGLDFALGSSETLEVTRELVGRIVSRDFKCEHRLDALLEAEKGFRRISGHDSLPSLIAALQRPEGTVK